MTQTQTEHSTGGRIDVIGHIWQPGAGVCAMTYRLGVEDVAGLRSCIQASCGADRDNLLRIDMQRWLDCNAGDFQDILDFHAIIDDGPLPPCETCGHHQRKILTLDWVKEGSGDTFNEAMSGTEGDICDDCGAVVPTIIGCPDGAEICQRCFDAGAH